jgi:glycosyltransferase involved in cell wall biosynthesis
MDNNGLSVVIPIYNEIGAMNDLPQRLAGVLEQMKEPVEFILVNDGSTDGSGEILKTLNVPYIRVIHHQRNMGYGATLKTGIAAAEHPWIAITDADNTYPDHRIPELFGIAKAESLDMLVGARIGKNVKIPLIRKPAKWFIGKLANYVANYKIPDINSGMRIFNKKTLGKYLSILPNGFSFTTTITLAMITCGESVKYVPIDYAHRTGTSKIRPIRDTLNFIQLVLRTSLLFDPLRIFIPTAISLFFAAVGVGLYSMLYLEKFMDTTVAILTVGSIQIMATGMIADIVNRRLSR